MFSPVLLQRLVFAALATLPLASIASPLMQAGGWEMKLVLSARETATGPFKTVSENTSRVCLSKEFLAKDPYLTPGIDRDKMEKKGAKCSISDPKRTDTNASWKMSCTLPDGNSADMFINNTVSARSLRSSIDQVIQKDGQALQMKINLKASHIGVCTGDMMSL